MVGPHIHLGNNPWELRKVIPLKLSHVFLLANNDEVASISLLEKMPQPFKLSKLDPKPCPKLGNSSMIHK
jgi:hypothetical protein